MARKNFNKNAFCHNYLITNDLWQPGPRNSLTVNDL